MPKKVIFNQTGSHEVLELADEAIPEPADDEVVVTMKTFGLNRADSLFYQGYYLVTPQFPSSVGVEGAGVVYSTGKKVSNFKKGDRISILPAFDFSKYGVLGEYAVVPKDAIIKMPEQFSFKDGASIWMSFLTAYTGLRLKGKLKERNTPHVVISAASSSVGLSAIQIAKRYKATVTATTRTFEKRDFLLKNGADYVIATQEEDIVQKIQNITNDKGYDIAFDALAGSFLNTLGEAAALEASIIVYGAALFMEQTPYPLFSAIAKGLDVSSMHVNINLLRHPDKRKEAVKDITSGFEKGIYRPVIDKIFPFSKFADAYAYLEKGSVKGKVLLEYDE